MIRLKKLINRRVNFAKLFLIHVIGGQGVNRGGGQGRVNESNSPCLSEAMGLLVVKFLSYDSSTW